MMGKDVERILNNVNNLINVINENISSFANEVVPADGVLGVPPIKPGRSIYPGTNHPMNAISDAMDTLRFADHQNMKSLNKSLFVGSEEFNNNIGSPWNELEKLNNVVSIAESYAASHGTLSDPGEKMGMLSIYNMMLSNAIDFKWAIIYYHDYIQRGYDNNYNNKQPSITFKTGLNKITNSNIKQKFEDNVNVKTPSIDPF